MCPPSITLIISVHIYVGDERMADTYLYIHTYIYTYMCIYIYKYTPKETIYLFYLFYEARLGRLFFLLFFLPFPRWGRWGQAGRGFSLPKKKKKNYSIHKGRFCARYAFCKHFSRFSRGDKMCVYKNLIVHTRHTKTLWIIGSGASILPQIQHAGFVSPQKFPQNQFPP